MRAAITANNACGNGVITFAILGAGVHTIALQSGLTVISRTVTMDGWSQGGGNYSGTPLIELNGAAAPGTFGLNIQANRCTVRGLAINRFPQQNGNGIGIGFFNPNGGWVYGCMIGVAPKGGVNRGNGQLGVSVASSAGGILLGTNGDGALDDQAANVIRGNNGASVLLEGNNNRLAGSLIGIDASGVNALPNNGPGIRVRRTGNALSANLIAFNASLGINLGDDGLTPNDALDLDGGPNGVQNFPVVASASVSGSNTVVCGTLSSKAGTRYREEFFASAAPAPSGYGEGQIYLGAVNVTILPTGDANLRVTLPAIAPGYVITATATDTAGNTSEFSPAVPVRRAYTLANARRCLGIAGGLTAATTADVALLDAVTDNGFSGRLDSRDAVRIARKAAGVEQNPWHTA